MTWRDRIEQIRVANPIEIVAARYTALRKQGRDWVGRCPLHEDHTPSFTVSPRNQRWFCFGCNTGGDVFRFVQLVEDVTFKEAIARLESPVAVPVRFAPPVEPPVKVLTEDEVQLLTEITEIYHSALLAEREPLGYLARRQITPAMIERHRLGYARPGNLLKHFPTATDRARLITLHLLNDEGREAFRHRVMMPERRAGQTIYVVGRATCPAQRAKYLGLFDVPKPLYGAARLTRREPVILCEGPMDYLTLDDWGYPTVALLGSYLKQNQVAELSNVPSILIATDSDRPGREAAARIAAQLGPRAHILPSLPGGAKDVNELAQQPGGRSQFAELVARIQSGNKSVSAVVT